ncbi:putative endonuclease/exonuclease/phosphatase family protein [Plasmodium gaboni]|uniref:Putative endonuclease/exonuclease/phosphatase family protein n=1 Tax=Plasmodium gaboni TaxID=647221 RepID=A0A151LVT8_9APIC|nr:putative endonuclease/exonuclease/phosphatase family protein [Plasmodium gaboni]KYO03305.1 putative endonuclease/exonuclease/phosphatase family protein [Plasmodium gaboni]
MKCQIFYKCLFVVVIFLNEYNAIMLSTRRNNHNTIKYIFNDKLNFSEKEKKSYTFPPYMNVIKNKRKKTQSCIFSSPLKINYNNVIDKSRRSISSSFHNIYNNINQIDTNINNINKKKFSDPLHFFIHSFISQRINNNNNKYNKYILYTNNKHHFSPHYCKKKNYFVTQLNAENTNYIKEVATNLKTTSQSNIDNNLILNEKKMEINIIPNKEEEEEEEEIKKGEQHSKILHNNNIYDVKENNKSTELKEQQNDIKNMNNVSLMKTKNNDSNTIYYDSHKNANILTLEELIKTKKVSNIFIINNTENEELNIELYFDHKELKLLRKKEETLNSLKNRLTLNLLKLEKKKLKRKRQHGEVKEQNGKDKMILIKEEKSEELINNIKDNINENICTLPTKEEEKTSIYFLDIDNNIIDENNILSNIMDKLKYVVINGMKIEIFKNLYELKQIYISMDVFDNHPIIPCNMPMNNLNKYIYYWIDSNDKNVIKSLDLFYVPNKEDVNKKLQLVIYDKENPFHFYVTDDVYVNENRFKNEMMIKNNRYSDFNNDDRKNNSCEKNIIRILSYNILAPIYTNTKYALEHMFKNIDPCYLKTNYRSHLLIHDINNYYDIISLQEVSEYLHNNLFCTFLNENYFSNYKPKNNYGNDGCSLFVNKKKFSLIEYKNYEFNQVIKTDELKNIYDTFLNLSKELDDIIKEIKTVFQIGIYMHKNTNSIFLISNTHFYFHSLAQHIRALQSYTILHILQTLKNKYQLTYPDKEIYVILNGDFNTNFDSEVFHFMQGKDISPTSQIWLNAQLFKKEFDDLDKYPNLFELEKNKNNNEQSIIGPHLDRKKFIPLYSAYTKQDIQFTNWNNNFIDVLDYIFLSTNIKVKKVLKGIDKECFQKYKGALSPINPSDHISIAAEVEL